MSEAVLVLGVRNFKLAADWSVGRCRIGIQSAKSCAHGHGRLAVVAGEAGGGCANIEYRRALSLAVGSRCSTQRRGGSQ